MIHLSAQNLKRIINIWPPFLGAGIQINHIASDFSYGKVTLKLRWYNKNYMGTQFGGSLYSMTDPMYMLLVLHRLGPDFIVWDKAGSIEYLSPGNSMVYAEFHVTDEQIAAIKAHTTNGAKYYAHFNVDILDLEQNVIAQVSKTLYVRQKSAMKNHTLSNQGQKSQPESSLPDEI